MKPIKEKKCKVCRQLFIPINSLQQVCNYNCAIILGKKNNEKKWQQKKAVLKQKTTNWKNSLQIQINKIVRLIDKDLPCLATKRKGLMAAGHVFSRGSNPTIKYNLHNIHRQCAQSNHFQSDDVLLREGLVNEYGQDYMTFISELRQTPALPYKNLDYMDFTKKAQKIALNLSKLDLTYTLQNRILMRNKINKELGIYEPKFCHFSNIHNIHNTVKTDNIDNIV